MSKQGGRVRSQARGRRPGFGTIESLPSGRYRVRWRDPSVGRVAAKQTFETLTEARGYLATVEADLLRRTYRAPRGVVETLSEYGREWIRLRHGLKASTRHQYEIDFRLHIEPYLGRHLVDRIESDTVRRWHAELGEAFLDPSRRTGGPRRDGSATVARAYRLLRAILQTAVDDELILRNPCRLAGAATARSPERPVLSSAEIAALASAVPRHYSAYVLLASFSGLRAGELAALRLEDLELGRYPQVRVRRRYYRVGGVMTVDAPKSEAGSRTVPLPGVVANALAEHLRAFRPGASNIDLVFETTGGRDVLDTASHVLRRGLDRIGRPDARAHDLRHTALTSAAEHGASLAVLMKMAGHSTADAAQRYQHATLEHARQVAAAINADAAAALNPTSNWADGYRHQRDTAPRTLTVGDG